MGYASTSLEHYEIAVERGANRRCAVLSRSVQRLKGARLSAMLDLSFRAMTDRLYTVAERVVEEGSEVVGVIVRTEARRAIVLATIS